MGNGMPETVQEALLRILDVLNGASDAQGTDVNGMPVDRESLLRSIAGAMALNPLLGNVEITDPQDGDVLTWDAANSLWKNAALPAGGGAADGEQEQT